MLDLYVEQAEELVMPLSTVLGPQELAPVMCCVHLPINAVMPVECVTCLPTVLEPQTTVPPIPSRTATPFAGHLLVVVMLPSVALDPVLPVPMMPSSQQGQYAVNQ